MELFYLFLNQCSPPIITELKSTAESEIFETKQDGIGLLGLIQEVMRGRKALAEHLYTSSSKQGPPYFLAA